MQVNFVEVFHINGPKTDFAHFTFPLSLCCHDEEASAFPCIMNNYLPKNSKTMKIKLSKQQVEEILANPEKAQEIGIKTNDPWWVIVLKVLAYLIGLLLAGVATTSCAVAAAIYLT